MRLTVRMRRSAEPRVAARGEVSFDATAAARIVNLSRGGACVCGALPPPGQGDAKVWPIALGLGDGREPILAKARLAWVNPAVEPGNDTRTFGLCFTQLEARDRARLDAEVAMPAMAERVDEARPVRLRLDGGPQLRATVESIGEHEAVVSAEISWLRVQSNVEAELDDRTVSGRVAWVGVEQSPMGATRLRLRLELGDQAPGRHDQTMPYFSTQVPAASPKPITGKHSAITGKHSATTGKHSAITGKHRFTRRDPSGAQVSLAGAHAQVVSLVKIGARRRALLAGLRLFVVALAISAAVLLVRSVRQSARAAIDSATPAVPAARP